MGQTLTLRHVASPAGVRLPTAVQQKQSVHREKVIQPDGRFGDGALRPPQQHRHRHHFLPRRTDDERRCLPPSLAAFGLERRQARGRLMWRTASPKGARPPAAVLLGVRGRCFVDAGRRHNPWGAEGCAPSPFPGGNKNAKEDTDEGNNSRQRRRSSSSGKGSGLGLGLGLSSGRQQLRRDIAGAPISEGDGGAERGDIEAAACARPRPRRRPAMVCRSMFVDADAAAIL